MSVNAERLFLALLFLAADVRDDVADHLRPVLKVLARAGDCLIGRDNRLIGLKLLPRRKDRRIALNRAVRLDRDKASLGAEALSLRGDNLKVLRVHLRNDHRDIRGPAVCRVVRDNRRLVLCIGILDCADFFLRHIDRREDKVHFTRHLLDLIHIVNDHLLVALRHRNVEFPAVADRLLIGLAGAPRARRQGRDLKPRVLLQNCQKTLPHHARCAENTDSQLFFRCVKFSFHPQILRTCAIARTTLSYGS